MPADIIPHRQDRKKDRNRRLGLTKKRPKKDATPTNSDEDDEEEKEHPSAGATPMEGEDTTAAILSEGVFTQPPTTEARSRSPRNSVQRRSSIEDPLELLRRYDTVCVVDDSSSMEGPLWYEARGALAGIADVAARYDVDGVDIYFLNSQEVGRGLKNGTEVKRLFDRITPYGITPTGGKLEELLLEYILKIEHAKAQQLAGVEGAMKNVKPVNFVVITDGEPTDDPESVIAQAARRLDKGEFPLSQVGIQFVQIGDDPSAAQSLQELDDGLSSAHGVRDMVDTFPYTAEGSQLTADNLIKILLGGINRRQDKRKASTS